MTRVFKHKQTAFPKMMVFAAFALVPLASHPRYALFGSGRYWAVFAALQALLWVFDASRRIVVSDRGIDRRIFLVVPMGFVAWEHMEEASVYSRPVRSTLSLGGPAFNPIRALAERSAGRTLEIVVNNWRPLSLFLDELFEGDDLEELVRARVRFVQH
jgi:hypothetical protein